MIKDLIRAYVKNLEVLVKITIGSIVATVLFYALVCLIGWGFTEKPLLSIIISILVLVFIMTFIMDYNDIYMKHKGGK